MIKRSLQKKILQTSRAFPILLLTGPRQVGKTTLLQMSAEKNRSYVSLDNLEDRILAQTDPALFLQNNPSPLIIDEVQYAPQLFSYLKIEVDRQQKPGMYWLTGSQKFHLMHGISESLAGRIAILDLLGLSQSEIEMRGKVPRPFLPNKEWIQKRVRDRPNLLSLKAVYQQIWRGSFPKVHQNPKLDRNLFYRSYLQTYVQRDVREIQNITNTITFNAFMVAIAARTGQVVNYADISRDAGIDNKTVKSWLAILETSGLIYLLQPYFNNRTKRIRKSPKLYFLDTGLCAYLTKWPNFQSLAAGAMSGAILETHLFIEILKSYWNNAQEGHFYYYRDFEKREIDLVIESGNTLYPVEFKKTATPSLNASKSFSLVKNSGRKVGLGAVVCFTEKLIPLSREVTAIPIGYL